MTAPALELHRIGKRFGDVVALDGASLLVREGRIHALLGENGAGKSTLMRIAYGLEVPDAGSISVRGVRTRFFSPADAIRAGVGMVQQHFTLVGAMTALENVSLGVSSGRRATSTMNELANQLAVRLDDTTAVGGLPLPVQQRVEILKALAREATVLVLDEPTATLAPGDVEDLFSWLTGFRVRGGSAVLITHKLREALAIADDITVLRQGRVSWSGRRHDTSADQLVTAMLGERALTGGVPQRASIRTGEPVAVAEQVTVRDAQGRVRVREATLTVRRGEIVGIAGVDGSGTLELLLALAGRTPPASGTLRLPTEVGFIPEDRVHDALLPDESIADNVILRGAARRRGWFRPGYARDVASTLLDNAGVRAPDIGAPVSTLSGGNQQRLVLARELDGDPPLLVAVNATRGLDVAATQEIRHRLRTAATAGMAIVYHASDLDELLDTVDRVVVMFAGRAHHVPATRDAVGRAMLGA